ncbi:MAG: hypothetical protein HY926_12430 [Elusimicrobia bacterium]|nr:hypothetical protein [Elusimicrobiota bacterium]
MPEREGRSAPAPVRHLTAGPAALARLAKLLGLSAAGAGWRLEGLCAWDGESVRVALRRGARRLVWLLLDADDPQAQVRAGRLGFRALDGGSPAELRLLEAWGRRLKGRGLPEIIRMISDDPESFSERQVPDQGGDLLKVPYVGAPVELVDSGWRNFFCDQDFDVLLGVPQLVSKGTVDVQYADLECYYARPTRNLLKWNFLDWPEGEDSAPLLEKGSHFTTELDEHDMILGTGAKADALVEKVRELSARGKFVVFTHLCTPIVLGEDFSGLARRCTEATGNTAVGWSQKDRDNRDNFGDYFRQALGRPGFFAGRSDPRAVNLFHFPRDLRVGEFAQILREAGLRVNVSLFPEVDLASVERIPRARWQVFCARSSYHDSLRALLEKSPLPVLTVPAPYGPAGTAECLLRVAAAAGRREAFAQAWKRRMRDFLPRWRALRRQARGLRLAFVVSESTLPRLWQLRYGQSAPLLPLVEAMGFGIDLLYYDSHGVAPNLPRPCPAAKVTLFGSPAELEARLRDGGFQAVFSDLFFDWRISRAGKGRFSSKDFEMGLGGALRSLERLLAVCRLPFYQRYAENLASVPRRLDAPRD